LHPQQEDQEKMKRQLAALFATATLVAACSSAAATPPPTATPTPPATPAPSTAATPAPTPAGPDCAGGKQATITFWHTYNTDGPETKQLDDVVIPAFERYCPNITVKAVVQPYNGLHDQLVTAVAGGGMPDLMRMDIIWTPEFAKLGALAEVDGLSGFDNIKGNVFAGPLATNAYKGKYYGVPLDTNTTTLIYNPKIIATPPTTTDELKTAAIAAKGNNKWGLGLGGDGSWNLFPLIWTLGGSITNDDYTKASGYLDSDKTVAALQWIIDLYKAGGAGPSLVGGKPDSWGGFSGSNYGMVMDGPWFFPAVGSAMGAKPAPMPTGPGGSISVIGGENLVIFKSSTNQDADWAFAKFMLSDEAQMDMAAVGQMPVTNSASSSTAMTSVDYYGPYIQQLKTAKPRPVTAAWTQMDKILTDAFDSAMRGKKTAAQALHDAAAQIDPLLAQ
jgi:multiple sugar transport system substrate-binding protein